MQMTAIGVAVLIRKNNQLLLIKRCKHPGYGDWAAPGGRLEFREEFAACAHREVFEETGVAITDLRFAGVTNDLHAEVSRHGVTIWFDAEYVSGELQNFSPDEVAEIRWFHRDELPAPFFLPLAQILAGQALR